MLFEEIITIYSENYTKPIIQNNELLIIEAGGTYSYYWVLRG
jgi:hypothetical protein